jgi:hypothetical protein
MQVTNVLCIFFFEVLLLRDRDTHAEAVVHTSASEKLMFHETSGINNRDETVVQTIFVTVCKALTHQTIFLT